MKEYESLLPLFLKIIKIQPASADTSYPIACLCSRKGMVEESIKWLNKALAKDPSKREFFFSGSRPGKYESITIEIMI
jgi:tetratricopeptide (TPR) repeat protein